MAITWGLNKPMVMCCHRQTEPLCLKHWRQNPPDSCLSCLLSGEPTMFERKIICKWAIFDNQIAGVYLINTEIIYLCMDYDDLFDLFDMLCRVYLVYLFSTFNLFYLLYYLVHLFYVCIYSTLSIYSTLLYPWYPFYSVYLLFLILL